MFTSRFKCLVSGPLCLGTAAGCTVDRPRIGLYWFDSGCPNTSRSSAVEEHPLILDGSCLERGGKRPQIQSSAER